MRLRVFAAVLMFAGLGLAAQADVTNPNFSPATEGYGVVPGWTGTPETGSLTYNTNLQWNNGTLPAGDTTVGFIQQDGSFTTTLGGLTPGQTYTLSFLDNSRDLTGDNCCNATPSLTVLVGGATLSGPTPVMSVGNPNMFSSVSEDFIAGATSETLEFLSTTPGDADGTLLLSDVHVVPATVAATPEPSSLMLLGTGILGAAGMVRRRFIRS